MAQIKEIERITYKDVQQIMNKIYIESIEDIEGQYGLENAQIKLRSNNDWYLIYGDYEDSLLFEQRREGFGIISVYGIDSLSVRKVFK